MASKTVDISGIGQVTLFKRRGSRSIRISFAHDGSIRVTVPHWVPYQAGIDFARAKAGWIEQHRPKSDTLLKSGDRIGKAHRLVFEPKPVSRTTARIADNQIRVAFAASATLTDPAVQKAAITGAQRALRREAEALLPQRLSYLAKTNGYSYHSVSVKQLKSRWGSCNSKRDITLSYYLMQLPWQLIDYVLLHELTHTEQMNHGAAFWSRFERAMPGAKSVRNMLKQYRPVVTPGS
jgi:predicted metal-dependent hydrolase